MALSVPPLTAGAALLFVYKAVVWVVMLFVKLCYSTALYATLAEINRRIAVFRQGKRPVLRAVLLLPTVVLFVTTILFALSFFRVIFGAQKITDLRGLLNAADIIFLFLRVGFLFAGVVLGAVLGVMVGRNIPVGRDRFGGLIYRNKGRYLGFWLFAFTLCGFFRLMPWGFVTYWTIWFLVLSACIVTAAHWTLYGALRAVAATGAPGLPPGEPVDLKLSPSEAVTLSALLRARGPMPFSALGQSLAEPDTSWLAHPVWTGEWDRMRQDEHALTGALDSLAAKGLAAKGPSGWAAAGAALRLRQLGFVQEAAGLTVREKGGARTVVLQRQGASALIVEPAPDALFLRELPQGADPADALVAAIS